jgi:hypothetical protein
MQKYLKFIKMANSDLSFLSVLKGELEIGIIIEKHGRLTMNINNK